MSQLGNQFLLNPYAGYAYSYPHKSAYRYLDPPIDLAEVWAPLENQAASLYTHVPVCEMRCGFCNLFTYAHPDSDFETRYLETLSRQVEAYATFLPSLNWTQWALGGGTPTLLSIDGLGRLFQLVRKNSSFGIGDVPIAIETSPATATRETIGFLKRENVKRVSIGVQSFVEKEAHAAGRPQLQKDVEQALENIRNANFERFNVDLMYGIAHQTPDTWHHSLQQAVGHGANEIYLYPLYVRPQTGLGKKKSLADQEKEWNQQRLELYQLGRDFLLGEGFHQYSMRHFSRHPRSPETFGEGCQHQNMLGLGVGARSYTWAAHYSTPYAVRREKVRSIVDDFLATPQKDFLKADYGIRLTPEDRQRRFVLQSLLSWSGLSEDQYQKTFRSQARDDFLSLQELVEADLARWDDDVLQLTASGMMYSDAIGPWLYSAPISNLMETFILP